MANEPLPNQLTVGQLKRIIEDVPDKTVVALTLPAGFLCPPELRTFYNVNARYDGGAVVRLSLQTDEPHI